MSVRKTDWGTWSNFQNCPSKSFAIGFRIRVESDQGNGDDTALNEIELICNDEDETAINGAAGSWGDWSKELGCEQGFIGFQMNQQEDQRGMDNTAANGLKMFCSNGTERVPNNNALFGSWTDPVMCPNQTVICGLRVQTQPPQGSGVDDTSLNNVDFNCCHPSTEQVRTFSILLK